MEQINKELQERRDKAVDELIDAFSLAHEPPRKFLPYKFPRKLLRHQMTQVATDEEIEAAKKTLYYEFWRALASSSDYPPTGKDAEEGPIADVYRDFGDPGTDFAEWWQRNGRDAFAEEEGTAARVLWDSGGAGHDDFPRMLIVEIYMHVPREDVLEDVDILLKESHPGEELETHLHRQAKRTLHPRSRYDDKAIAKALSVWNEARKERGPDWSKIADALSIKANSQDALQAQMRSNRRKGRRLTYHAARGEFPNDEPLPDEREAKPVNPPSES